MAQKLIHKQLNKKAVERLTILADFMRKQKPERAKYFNMGAWFLTQMSENQAIQKGLPVCKPLTERDIGPVCKTQACAMGFAAVVPKLQKLGLSLQIVPDSAETPGDGWEAEFFLKKESYGGDGIAAAEAFFRLDNDQAVYLFGDRDSSSPNTPKQWAERADYFIQTDGLIAHNDY